MASLFDEDTPSWVRATLAGGTALIVALVALVVFLIVGSGDDTTTTADPGQTGSSGTQTSSVCGLPDGDQGVPSVAPSAAWVVHGGLSMPTNPELGPGLAENGARSCFAHSPAGAVFSAMNPPDSGKENSEGLQYAGFRVDDYTPSRVTMQLAFVLTRGTRAGVMFSIPATLVWKNGDWSDASGNDATPVILPSLAGFVSFGPGGN